MPGDIEAIFGVSVAIAVLAYLAWLYKLSQAADDKKRALRNLVICVAFISSTSYELISRFYSPRIHATGTITESHASHGRYDSSYFRFQANTTKNIRLNTTNSVARSLQPFETIDVLYENWGAHPIKLTVTSGPSIGLVVVPQDDSFPVVDSLVLLIALIVAIWNIVTLRQLPE